jgi:protein cornichon
MRFSKFVLPENIAHAFLTTLFLVSGQWTAFLLNAPLLAFNANKYDMLSVVPCSVP